MESTIYKGYRIEVDFDEFADNPRELCEYQSEMICAHKRYNLGDEDFDSEDFDGWDDMENFYGKNCIILPLYLYDHSGITMNTTGFHCPWDSGQVGVIRWKKESIRKEFNIKRITKKHKTMIEEHLKGEIQEYDRYLRGDIYMVQIFDNETDELIDSTDNQYSDVDDIIKYAKEIIDMY